MKKEITINGSKIIYHTHGEGKPVVLVHGFGEDSRVWNLQVAALQKNCQLIVPDLPGSGGSSLIDDMSMEGMAAGILQIINKEIAYQTPVHMIGHSMGGYITLAFLEKYPEQIASFGLFHSTSFADTEEKKEIRRKGIAFIRQYGAFEFLKTTTPNMFSQETRMNDPGLVEAQIENLRYFTADALIAYYNAMIQRPDRSILLKKALTSVLFVMGEHDNAVPLSDVLKQCHLPDFSYFHVLKKSGHMGMLEEPEKANRILEEFLLSD